jgi:hypothetical protein
MLEPTHMCTPRLPPYTDRYPPPSLLKDLKKGRNGTLTYCYRPHRHTLPCFLPPSRSAHMLSEEGDAEGPQRAHHAPHTQVQRRGGGPQLRGRHLAHHDGGGGAPALAAALGCGGGKMLR